MSPPRSRRLRPAEKFWIVVGLALLAAAVVALIGGIGFLAWWAMPGGLR